MSFNVKRNNRPPRFARRFLQWFCPDSLFESIEGDLMEQYERDLVRSIRYANFHFAWNVLRFFRPSIILRNKPQFVSFIMLGSYFRISFRHLSKKKTFAAINILGLAIGMATALLIYEYITFESGYDGFHTHADNIYRVTTVWNQDKTPEDKRATAVAWAGPGIKDAFPEVLDYARFAPIENFTGYNSVTYGETKINEQRIFMADPGFLRMFSFRLLKGSPAKALAAPTSIIITESIAKKYFDTQDPIGKMLVIDSHGNLAESNFVVTGIIEDPPVNSHFSFDFLLSFKVVWDGLHNGSTYWHWDYTYAYLQLHQQTDISSLEQRISDLRVKQFGSEMQYYDDAIHFKLQPLRGIHLHSALKGEISINGDGRAVDLLALVGICILISAYINYVNLSTVSAIQRQTEIGIRKVVGSSRYQLTLQLVVESFVINILALGLALLLFMLSVPLLEALFNLQWLPSHRELFSLRFVSFSAMVIAGSIVLSILYPAFILSSFRPAEVLKGKTGGAQRRGGLSLRSVLIIAQFVFCIGFSVATYAIYLQLKHMKQSDLGMHLGDVVAVKGYGFEAFNLYENVKAKLSSSAGILAVGTSSAAPGDEIIELGLKPQLYLPHNESVKKEIKLALIDESFLDVLQIRLAAGRNFDRHNVSDGESVMLNESAAKQLGFSPDKIIGETVAGLSEKPLKVIGVIRDYHQRSLKAPIEPMVFASMWKNVYGWSKRYTYVRFGPASTTEERRAQLMTVEKAWKEVNPGKPFQYFFLDTYFDQQYKADTSFTSLFMFCSGLAILIACLGLFGLVAYATLQRTKEIGVRKVLGASVQNILALLSKDFAKMILVAALVAVPVVTLMLSQWLERYAYRITLDLWIFAIPILSILLIAFITVTFRSLKAATANPVDSLRYE